MRRFATIASSLTLAVLLVALLLASLPGASAPATAAPAAIPTPASVTRPSANGNFITFSPFAGTASIAEDTYSSCYDVGKYSTIDVLYVIDQGTTNTTTLTSYWSIDGTTKAAGVNVVASNAADATDMAQLQVFGRYFCLLANVTNTEAITITAQAIAK
jgi:hypothetical protein